MLITPFEIQIRRPAEFSCITDRRMADAGVKPDIQNVSLLFEVFLSASGAFRAWGNEGFSGLRVPDIHSLLFNQLGDMLKYLCIGQRLRAVLAIKYRDWNPPGSLA